MVEDYRDLGLGLRLDQALVGFNKVVRWLRRLHFENYLALRLVD